jgi:hypothetical protein
MYHTSSAIGLAATSSWTGSWQAVWCTRAVSKTSILAFLPSSPMPSACSDTGIVPNPDISGIGVRAAIYAQAVLTLVQPILASIDGHISEKELIGLHRLYLGILLPGCALLISAIIQATTQGLSVYHATVVLQLSWINNTSALIFFQFALIAQLGLDKEREFRHCVGLSLDLLYKMMEKNPSDGLLSNSCTCSLFDEIFQQKSATC